jgi:hypothetical protein
MSAHTPGPWRISARGLDKGIESERGPPIAFPYGPTPAVREANAKLIAAAPDLLAALIEAHSWLTEYNIGSAPVLKLIQSAIDKATGVPHA